MRFISHEDAYEVTTKNHAKVVVDAQTLEFPQVDTLVEATEFAGGEDKLLSLINDMLYSRSKNGALALVRNAATDVTPPEAIKKAAAYSKGYNPSQERVSKQAVLDGVDQIRAIGKEQLAGMDQAALLALIERTLKI